MLRSLGYLKRYSFDTWMWLCPEAVENCRETHTSIRDLHRDAFFGCKELFFNVLNPT